MFGHFGQQRLFLTLADKYYWKLLYADVNEYCKTWKICLKAKRNYNLRTTLLNPLQVPIQPFELWGLDHNVLTRTRKQGNVALLCMIDRFTLWPVVRAVKDLTAETTAKVFFQEICAVFGIPKGVISDRGISFTGVFFKTLMKLLNVHHRMSSARVSRTNGLTKNLIQRVNQLIPCYCDDDTETEHALPLIEMSLRSSVHTKMRISSYKLVFGKQMYIGEPIRITDASNLQYTQK